MEWRCSYWVYVCILFVYDFVCGGVWGWVCDGVGVGVGACVCVCEFVCVCSVSL